MSVPLLCGFEGLRFNCMVARLNDALTFYPHNHAVKPIILKNFKLFYNDSETSTIFLQDD